MDIIHKSDSSDDDDLPDIQAILSRKEESWSARCLLLSITCSHHWSGGNNYFVISELDCTHIRHFWYHKMHCMLYRFLHCNGMNN